MIFVWCSGNNIISPYLATRRISKLDLHFAEDPVIFFGGNLGNHEQVPQKQSFLKSDRPHGTQAWPPYGIVCRTPPTPPQRKTLWEVKVHDGWIPPQENYGLEPKNQLFWKGNIWKNHLNQVFWFLRSLNKCIVDYLPRLPTFLLFGRPYLGSSSGFQPRTGRHKQNPNQKTRCRTRHVSRAVLGVPVARLALKNSQQGVNFCFQSPTLVLLSHRAVPMKIPQWHWM